MNFNLGIGGGGPSGSVGFGGPMDMGQMGMGQMGMGHMGMGQMGMGQMGMGQPMGMGNTMMGPPIVTNQPMRMGGYPVNQMQIGIQQPYGMQPQMGCYPNLQQQQGMMIERAVTAGIAGQMDANPFSSSGIPGLAGVNTLPPCMPLPAKEGVPAGLELLSELDGITVKQMPELLEIMTGYETANRYNILNSAGQRVYFGAETSDSSSISCGGAQRPFEMTIVDFSGKTVLKLDRPCDPMLYLSNCCCCCFGQIGGQARVTLGDGVVLGDIVHSWSSYRPVYNVVDTGGTMLMKIVGEGCSDCCCCTNGYFDVQMPSGAGIGIIKKKWDGLDVTQMVCDADTFGVNFPKDLDVKWKALILASVFLIDFMYFETSAGQNQNQHGYNRQNQYQTQNNFNVRL